MRSRRTDVAPGVVIMRSVVDGGRTILNQLPPKARDNSRSDVRKISQHTVSLTLTLNRQQTDSSSSLGNR